MIDVVLMIGKRLRVYRMSLVEVCEGIREVLRRETANTWWHGEVESGEVCWRCSF